MANHVFWFLFYFLVEHLVNRVKGKNVIVAQKGSKKIRNHLVLICLAYVLQVADYLKSDTSQHNDFAVGLHNEFQPINGHDIGQFADMNFAKQGSEQEMSATCT